MNHQTIERGGKTYVLVEAGEFERLVGTRLGLPSMPQADNAGNVDAVQYARASIAREIITRREAAGLTQTDLARAAGVRVETVNRIENAMHTADVATISKLDAALSAAQPRKARADVGKGRAKDRGTSKRTTNRKK